MLILVAVTVSTVVNSGLFQKASDAGKEWKEAETQETNVLTGNITINGKNYDSIDDYAEQSNAGTFPYMPDSTFTKVAGTNLSTGLVIRDTSGNEYVWIEVPKISKVYPTAGLNITTFTAEDYTKIENDLHTYTEYYRSSSSNDEFYEDSTTGWFADETAYNTAKNKMLKSVYENGGFWIGRYEAGITTARTANGEATTLPVSKANMYPYNYVTRTQAKVLAERVSEGKSYTSGLMFGVQWDLVITYLKTKGVDQEDLKTDSTNWGNYKNNHYGTGIVNASAQYSVDDGQNYGVLPAEGLTKTSDTKCLLTTGASDTFRKQNIYDLAGNICEWTLENSPNNSAPCVGRGGCFGDLGTNFVACSRNRFAVAHSYTYYLGFRVSLYK